MSPQPLYQRLDPILYLGLARELAPRPDGAAIRTAADRIYFAAFLTNRKRLAEKDYFTPNYDFEDHQRVIEKLKEKLGSIGNNELRLRNTRNRINYDTRDLYYSKDVRSLEWMFATAEQLIQLVEALPPSSDESRTSPSKRG